MRAVPATTDEQLAAVPLPAGPAGRRWRLLDRLVVAAFALALVIPGALLAAHVRAARVENRDPRPMPSLSLSGVLDATWQAGVDGFVTDRLAVRSYAIRLRGEAIWLAGGTGNPTVIRGHDDWLFIRGEFEPACRFTGAQLGAALEAAAAEFEATGQEFGFLLVPDKHSVYPDKVSDRVTFPPSCQEAGRADLAEAIGRLAGRAADATPVLVGARSTAGSPDLYYSQDTHWTPTGAALGVGALIRAISPATWRDDDVQVVGTRREAMDTARLLGLRHVAVTPKVVLRPGVEQHRADVDVPVQVHNARAVFRITCAGDRPLLGGRTLILYDSFFGIDTALVAPYFADSTWVHVGDMLNHPELGAVLGRFDRIVLERVERGIYSTDLAAMLGPLARSPGG